MLDNIKKYEKTSIATSILLVIFSLFLIFKPEASLNFIVIVIGAFMALVGIIHMVSYFTANKEFKSMSTELIEGTLYAVIGIFLIFKPNLLNEFLGVIVGTWQVIQFIIKFQFAFNLKSVSSPSWSLMLLSSILHLVFGIVMILNPFGSIIAITTFAGIVLLITEIGNIAESIYLLIKA
jgi:uncharacterized membrane protein HdeD (DUF308 family)